MSRTRPRRYTGRLAMGSSPISRMGVKASKKSKNPSMLESPLPHAMTTSSALLLPM